MKNGKYSKRRGVASKTLVLALAVMLIVGARIRVEAEFGGYR